ncbi:hypothetical protein [Natronococcus wangiae]|uniref:hypothetical protein n=1 Tax=Natronococcus wangiae TaxID=3068275 RepID=UPI00273E8571|nr:hypothetical protein [Natronococcus sp. AD5]
MSRGSRPGGRSSRTGVLTTPSTRLAIAFVLLVGLSGGLIAIQGDASPTEIGLAVFGGLVAGGGLLWYLSWILE